MRKNILLVSLLAMLGLSGLNAQNNCLTFDGTNDYVDCGTSDQFEISDGTIEVWSKISELNRKHTLFSKYKSGGFYNSLLLRTNDTDNKLWFYLESTSTYAAIFSDNAVLANTWYHVAIEWGSGGMKMYVNGILQTDTDPATYPMIAEDGPVRIGQYDNSEFAKGEIDEVRVWNDARTETEIRQNMYRELPDPAGETNLVAYYKLNETSGTTATDAKGSYDGTLTNYGSQTNYWQTSPAMFGPKNALDFDGSYDYVDISGLHVSGSAITVETWVYFNSFNGSAGPDYNISNLFRGGDENIVLRIGDGGLPNNMPQWDVTISGSQKKLNANARLSINTWYHIAGVYDGTELKLYINGELDNSMSQSGSLTTTTNSFWLGGSNDNSRMFEGQMDEVRVWNDARTASEIRENMCKNLTGNESGLMAYYSCDNTSGTSLPDFSGNDYEGTLTNMDNSDWVASSAFNTWLNTSSTDWSTTTNWSRGSVPVSGENVGICNFTNEPDIPASQTFGSLYLGIGVSTTIAGNIKVNGGLILDKDLDITTYTVSLGSSACLIENNGTLSGTSGQIQTTRTLSNISSINVAGLGAEITTSANMGSTTIIRSHVAATDPISIARRYQITPTTNTGLNATLVFYYNDDELNGLTESSIRLLRSTDGGTTWDNSGGFVNTAEHTITRSAIDAFSTWTAGAPLSPIIETSNPSQDYYSGTTSVIIAPAVTVTYTGDITVATVSVSPVETGDILSVSGLPAGLSSGWNTTTKILTISGTSGASDYQTALRLIKFESTSTTSGTRTIDFNLGDGIGLTIGGQKHFYEVIGDGSTTVYWTDARAVALNSIYAGSSGYLVTIMSETENNYLKDKVTEDTWIGASDAVVDGVWKWMDGPEAGIQFWQGDQNGSAVGDNYNNWLPGEEPNNWNSQEHYAHLRGPDLPTQWGNWNDYSNTTAVKYYIVEYGGDCTVFTTLDDATIEVKTELTWDGSESSVWTTSENWVQEVAPNTSLNVLIPDVSEGSENDPIISSDTDASCNKLTVNTNATLTIGSSGSLITNGSITNDGTINLEREIAGWTQEVKGWHFLASPVASQAIRPEFVSNPLANGEDFFFWDESDDQWVNTRTIDNLWNDDFETEFKVGKGYFVAYQSGDTKVFTGTPNNADVPVSDLSNTETTTYRGWNLIGNPFASSLSWLPADEAWNLSNIQAVAKIWHGDNASYSDINSGDVIPSRQGFMVHASNNQTGSLTIPKSQRIHNSQDWYKSKSADRLKLTVYDLDINTGQETILSFNPDATHAYDPQFDSYFLAGYAPMFYSSIDGKAISTNVMPAVWEALTIPLYFYKTEAAQYKIKAEGLEAAAPFPVYITDRLTQQTHNLSLDPEFSFLASASDRKDRFLLHFTENVGISENPASNISCAFHQDKIVVLNPDGEKGILNLINFSGQVLHQYVMNGNTREQFAVNQPAGIYIINIKTEKTVISRKVFIQ